MKSPKAVAGSLIVVLLASGCASTEVVKRQSSVGANEKLPRPERIVVYPFAGTPADIPQWSQAAQQYSGHTEPPTAEELQAARELGVETAKELAAEINEMGLKTDVASDRNTPPGDGDVAIIGYFLSVDEGSAVKRIALGFGSGAAELKTEVEVYQQTAQGLRRLGSGEVDAGGGKLPGVVVPAAVTIATANPIGLVVGGAVKAGTELSGRDTIHGAAKRTAGQIADELEKAFKRHGWI
jgi:hypothetical protein